MAAQARKTLTVDDVVQRNKEYVSTTHKPPPTLLQRFQGSFSNGPHTHIVACLDSRCNPYIIFGLAVGDALVMRNPGGRVWSALPDIVALDSRFDISQLVLLQHSDCGTSHLTEQLVDERIKTAAKPDAVESTRMRDDVVQYKISHGEEGVREDLALLKAQPFLRKELVEGAVGLWLDVISGVVKEVKVVKTNL